MMLPSPAPAVWRPGSDPNARDGPGRAPLHLVCRRKPLCSADIALIGALLAAGGDPNLSEGFGRSALCLTCMESGSSEAAALLLESGADANHKDQLGRSPLHWCADRGWVRTAELLLKHGADMNIQTHSGDTPLHWAAKAGRSLVVELLVAAGCELDITNNRGQTALHTAADVHVLSFLSGIVQKQQADGEADERNPEAVSGDWEAHGQEQLLTNTHTQLREAQSSSEAAAPYWNSSSEPDPSIPHWMQPTGSLPHMPIRRLPASSSLVSPPVQCRSTSEGAAMGSSAKKSGELDRSDSERSETRADFPQGLSAGAGVLPSSTQARPVAFSAYRKRSADESEIEKGKRIKIKLRAKAPHGSDSS